MGSILNRNGQNIILVDHMSLKYCRRYTQHKIHSNAVQNIKQGHWVFLQRPSTYILRKCLRVASDIPVKAFVDQMQWYSDVNCNKILERWCEYISPPYIAWKFASNRRKRKYVKSNQYLLRYNVRYKKRNHLWNRRKHLIHTVFCLC